MADDFEKELSKSEKLLKERLTKAGKIAKDITNQAFKELLVTIDDYSNSLDNITDQLASQLQDYDKIKQSTKQFGEALKSNLVFVKDNKDLASKLTQIYSENNKLANKLVENNENLITGQLKSQDVARDIAKSRQTQLTIELSQRDIAQEIAQSEREMVGLQGEELYEIGAKLEALREINEQLEAEKENQQAISTNLQEQAASTAKIETKVGVGGKLLQGLKKIPVLGDILDVGGAEEAMRSAAAGGASGFKTMGAGVKALGPSLKAAMGPLALLSLAVEAVQMLIGAMLDADKQVTDIAQNFNIIKEDAAETRDRFFELSDNAGKFGKIQSGNLILQKDLVKYNMELNEALGTSIDLSSNLGEEGKKIAVQFANASKFLKLGADEQKGLMGLTATTGKYVDNTTKNIL
jgi:DNA repair exonuclease SbcCD ATPase subunit